MDTVERIFELLDSMHMEQQAFAAAVGVSDDTASDWRRRRSASFNKRLPQIAEVLNTTTEYLLTGQGARVKGTEQPHKTGEVTEADIKAAFWGGEKDLTPEDLDAMWNDVKDFAAFVADKKRREKEGKK